MATDATLVQTIAALKKLKVGGLREKYKEVFGEATKSSNKDYLFKRIAYRLQEKKYGGLSERAQKRAAELAKDAPIHRRPPLAKNDALVAKEPTEAKRPKERDPRLPKPGTVLSRTFKDKEHTVRVLPDGFEYKGKTYRSLSAIGALITGSACNGFAFFHLGKKEQAAAQEAKE
jgi:hypothetical protein